MITFSTLEGLLNYDEKCSASWTRASEEILLVLGQFHHPSRSAQVKVRNSAYQLHANHLLATAAHNRPLIIVALS